MIAVPTQHPTSRAVVHATRRLALPAVIVQSLPRSQRPHCLGCDCQIWSGHGDGPQLCWSCRRRFDDETVAADDAEFRNLVLVRLVCTWGAYVDLAEWFATTDRARIRTAVKWWRAKGAKISGSTGGEYKIVGWGE